MGDRGVAPVVDLAQARRQRARTGGGIGRGQLRRVSPGLRPARAVMAVDWEAYGQLDRSQVAAVEKGTMEPPLRVRKFRRVGVRISRRAMPLSRSQRRLAWKVERRDTGVAWSESRAARGELAPVVPIGHRGTARRLRVRPVDGATTGGDLLDGAA